MQNTLVEELILFSGLNHVNPKHKHKNKLIMFHSFQTIINLPLLPKFVNSVEDIQFITWDSVGVNVVHDLVHTDECPCPSHTCTAVDQQWTRGGTNVVGVKQDMGQLHQSHQVTCAARS